MTVAILSSFSMVLTAMAATAVVQDDLLQDAGSWAQFVGEFTHFLRRADIDFEK
jgi:hypothetical protein